MQTRNDKYSNYVNNIYNPSNLTEQEIVDNFSIRKKEFNLIFDNIKNSDMKYPEQHFIIEGLRGYGKTTLLRRLYIEINKDANLKSWLIPIRFPEEQYGIRYLFKLWEMSAKYLEIESSEFMGLYDELDSYSENPNYDDICFQLLERKLKEKKRKIILLIDNIGDLLKKFDLVEQQKLREILLTSAEIRIIGTSAGVLEFTFDYGAPFFDFFKPVRLKGLSENELVTFLGSLGNVFEQEDIKTTLKHNKAKIEVLRRLTGGVPRTIVLLFDIFVGRNNGSTFNELDAILDRVTTLYKSRMDSLSPVQQELIDIIALKWDGITSKEIADTTKTMKSKEVSAQLKQLEKYGLIEKIPLNLKNFMYQIKERFFNIWYLMRFGDRTAQNKVIWLICFLESWCSREELEEIVKEPTESVEKNNLSLKLIRKSIESNKIFANTHSLAMILLWNDMIKESIEAFNESMGLTCNSRNEINAINEFFMLLMAKKLYNSLLKIFSNDEFNLKDRFKPTYYALLYFIKEQDGKLQIEYKKMSQEYKETVEEIIEEIKKEQEIYK